jgi:DNA-binding PadR family transcriptional regulator
MRRRAGALLPLEVDILEVAASAHRAGDGWVHGFRLAKMLQEGAGAGRLTGHGTLYKALGRLSAGGLLEDRWEEPELALAEGRPRRRLYRVTAEGQRALAGARAGASAPAEPSARRIAPA